jgi:hypothetical protein
MNMINKTCVPLGDVGLHNGLSGLLAKVIRSLFGGGAVIDSPSPKIQRLPVVARAQSSDDDLGWLSLTLDADGHSLYEREVVCLGVTPDDLDLHDPDGGDLSWIGLSPVKL